MVPRHVDVKGNRKAAPVFCSFFFCCRCRLLSQCHPTSSANAVGCVSVITAPLISTILSQINWLLQVSCQPAQRLYTAVSSIIHTPAPPPSQKQSRFNFYVAWGSLKVNELRVHVRFYSLTSSCSSTAVATWSSPVLTPGEVQALTLLLTNAARLWALSFTFSTT